MIVAGMSVLLTSSHAVSQDIEIEDLQRNIDIFSNILEEVLELDQGSGLFGLTLAGIDNNYLLGQGVVFEIRTPLANRRNRINLASLNSAMQSLQIRTNSFVSTRTAALSADSDLLSPLTLMLDQANSYYLEMMEKLVNFDYSFIISSAIQQALDSSRSLRSLDGIGEEEYELLRNEIEIMRISMNNNLGELQEIEQEIRRANSDAALASENSSERESDIGLRVDTLLTNIESLRERVVTKAQELKERNEAAKLEYMQRWERDLIDFESDLYLALCDYGSSLRELPENENISIILIGLGEESTQSTRRTNKVHIISKASVLRCQRGEIDSLILQQRSAKYSY